jgi:monoamine oxidase
MTSRYFDDGCSAVPNGVTTPVERVIVIGAGIAGLATANALTQAGVDCVVLEARDRLGGRLHTVDLAGWAVDLGGSWIHMPQGNPLTTYSEHVGISRRPGDPLAELVAYDCAEHRRLSSSEWAASIEMQYETFPNAQSRLLEQLGPGASMAEAIEAFLEDSRLGSSDLRRARQAITAVIEAEAADFCIEQSLRWMWNELEYEGSYFGDLPTGGYASVIGEMAKGVDVRLATEVSEVQYGSAGVAVRASNGELEWGSHVVVTVPLGVLKQNRPSFSPDLSAERRATIDRLGFGTFEKVALAFERPFWREAGTPHVVVFPADPNEPAIWVLGDDGFGGGPILTALIFRSSAHRVLETTLGDCADWLLALLSADFHTAISTLLSGVVEAEAPSTPPRDGGVGDVGRAQHRRVGAAVEPHEEMITPVVDDAASREEAPLERVGGGS